MEHQDYLFTIAEVAAAFVGFSMVVGALSSDRPWLETPKGGDSRRGRDRIYGHGRSVGSIRTGANDAGHWRCLAYYQSGPTGALAFWIPDIVSPIPGGLRVVLSGAFARQTSRVYQHRRRDNWQQPSVVECRSSWAGHGIPLPGGLAFVAPHCNLAFFAGWIPIAKLTHGRRHRVP